MQLLSKDKLTGSNYLDWMRSVRIALRYDKKEWVLDTALPEAPADDATRAVRDAWQKHKDQSDEVACLMLATMVLELQKSFETAGAFDMADQLKEMFQEQARQERYDTMISLLDCKQQEGTAVSAHMLKMKAYVDRLERLGFSIAQQLVTDIILHSLSSTFSQFTLNFNMNGLEKTIMELHGMLKTAEANMSKSKNSSSTAPVLAIREGAIKKRKAKKPKGKGKGQVGNPNSNPSNKGKAGSMIVSTPNPDEAVFFHCGEKGHRKRTCPKYLEEIKKIKPKVSSTSGIYMIELHNTSTTNSWVLDTRCGTHICSDVQGLRRSKKLRHGELDLIMGNRHTAAVKRIGDYELVLSTGFSINLLDCCYSPEMAKNIISFNTSKSVLDKSCLWHCRLGHINKKRIAKLQEDGILESFDLKSDDVCESCLLGKMTKAPFTGNFERGKDLLDLIHSDVCGPFRSATRHGERYFVTFTDDFSRYGYVYLIKHKSETFEVFKRFQNEVENQRGKRIKILRSDRGREYLSQEFYDHLGNCGIVSQLTPPGTPQHNGVAERRNRTLLDMVRSMMSRAMLPISFWGYALETAVKVLNLVPTKKIQEPTNKGPDVGTSSQSEVEKPVEPQPSTAGESDIPPPPVRRSDRVRHAPEFYGLHITEGDESMVDDDEPTSYQEAMAGPDAAKWKEAMESEMKSMYDNQVWNLVDQTPGLKTVGCKWVFKKKTDMDGKVHTYKARLVAKGYTQTQRIDYEETFSPVAMIKSIRILFAIAAFYDYEIWQMDVKTAFLNGKLSEDHLAAGISASMRK
ncbi:hypothetical protein L2E82_10363 [Cichorium intybus]|uniref:Uncharacterized protein n=1 Tax=Cichorium intybus TaxID=13427 RepID=A0ACB9GA93_CICIN|nr:hypothetical protein L2E82_10363 [Cichorium intybus]